MILEIGGKGTVQVTGDGDRVEGLALDLTFVDEAIDVLRDAVASGDVAIPLFHAVALPVPSLLVVVPHHSDLIGEDIPGGSLRVGAVEGAPEPGLLRVAPAQDGVLFAIEGLLEAVGAVREAGGPASVFAAVLAGSSTQNRASFP